jgi:hypothetical protein
LKKKIKWCKNNFIKFFEVFNLEDKTYKIKDLEKLKEKIKTFPESKLYITEEKLKKHITENEILELLKEGILEDKFYE